MKALVTGGGGFLGGVIVRMLRERGDQVRSFSVVSILPWQISAWNSFRAILQTGMRCPAP